MKLRALSGIWAVIMLLSTSPIFSQTGTVRGKVSGSADGEALVGATVRLLLGDAIRGGAYTDVEGTYNIKAPVGTYSLIISYLSYISDTLTDVTVTAGDVVYNESLLLEENAVREDLVVDIVAKRSEASETAFLAKKQNAINSIDGVTFDLVSRTGDANAAAAVQRVVGVSVEGGKYVFVRGLGDRYSKTMLNGAELPGLDPNRNTVQMDVFPSNLIDNIIVYKNFTPDLPGSFTGGLVDVRTKDFPAKFTLRASASLGYNTQASLRDDFLADPTYGGEALGFGNEIRDMPTYIAEDLGGGLPRLTAFTLISEVQRKGPQLDRAARSFQTSLAPQRRNSGLNQRYEVSAGNQHLFGKQQDWGNRSIGYIVGLSYRRNFSYFESGQRNQYAPHLLLCLH
ncbi:MAG: carboxypeptidase regulatory-like domain-containing protein [Bacteroidota bacterium]